MTIPEPSYITESDVAENTLITGLQSLSTENRKKLIQRAESQIDKYVGRQPHHPADSNTDRVFPRVQDYQIVGSASGITHYPDTPQIPLEVSEACLAQVEYLYTQWWSTSTTTQAPVQKNVESENIGGDGSYSATYANGGKSSAEDMLCAEAKAKLEGFVNRFVPLSVTDPDHVLPPT